MCPNREPQNPKWWVLLISFPFNQQEKGGLPHCFETAGLRTSMLGGYTPDEHALALFHLKVYSVTHVHTVDGRNPAPLEIPG